jgi:hypothetical protein
MKSFKFSLGENVVVEVSGEIGEVIGRAEYTNSTNNYFVRYRSADGRAVEAWWQEDALRTSE